MAYNLINSNDITVTQTGNNIQLNTTVDMQTLESNVGNISDLKTTVKTDLVNAINSMTGTILWTNSSPTSSFGSQTINLNSGDYDMYEIIYTFSTTSGLYLSTGKIPKQQITVLSCVGTSSSSPYFNVRTRGVTSKTDTSITFDTSRTGSNISTEINNNANVPIYVIGYKTGLNFN